MANEKNETKKVSENKSGKVWVSLDIEDIKTLKLDPKKVTGSDVNRLVRKELGLKEKARGKLGLTEEQKEELKERMKEVRAKIIKEIKK